METGKAAHLPRLLSHLRNTCSRVRLPNSTEGNAEQKDAEKEEGEMDVDQVTVLEAEAGYSGRFRALEQHGGEEARRCKASTGQRCGHHCRRLQNLGPLRTPRGKAVSSTEEAWAETLLVLPPDLVPMCGQMKDSGDC